MQPERSVSLPGPECHLWHLVELYVGMFAAASPWAPAFAEAVLRYLLLRPAHRLPRKQLPVVGKPPYRKVATRKSLGGEYCVGADRVNCFRVADEPLAIRKRYGVTEEISLSFLRARQGSGLLV
jgi:hypothetical protein